MKGLLRSEMKMLGKKEMFGFQMMKMITLVKKMKNMLQQRVKVNMTLTLILVLMQKKNEIGHMSYLMRHKFFIKSLIKMRVIYTL